MKRFTLTLAAAFVMAGFAAEADAQNRGLDRWRQAAQNRGTAEMRQPAQKKSPQQNRGNSGPQKQFFPGFGDWKKPPFGQPGPVAPKKVYTVSEIHPFTGVTIQTQRYDRRDQALAFQTRIKNKYWVSRKAGLDAATYHPFDNYGNANAYQQSQTYFLGPATELRQGRASGIIEQDADVAGSRFSTKGKTNSGKPQTQNRSTQFRSTRRR